MQNTESRSTVLPKVFRQSYPEVFGRGVGPLSEKSIEELMARTALGNELNASKGPEPAPSLPQESASEAGTPTSAKRPLTVDLASGGTVEIGGDVDLLRLDKADREFVFDLIDKVRAYRDDRQRERRCDVEPDDDREPAFRGDEEVPF